MSKVVRVWRVTLNIPQMGVGHNYNQFDIVAPNILVAIRKAQKYCTADGTGTGKPYVSEAEEITRAEQ